MSDNMDTILNRKEKTISSQLRDIDVTLDMIAQGQLTLREHYAGMAMQGILANCAADQTRPSIEIVSEAVKYADMLIDELSKRVSDE